MSFKNEISVGDIVNIALFILALIGLLFTYRQIKENFKTQKATFFKDLYSIMYTDTSIAKAFYALEYGKFKYDNNFHGSDSEGEIDRLLSFANLVCDLYFQQILTEREMRFFKYRFLRIFTNTDIQNYLKFLTPFYSGVDSGTKPYNGFVSYCEKNSLAEQKNSIKTA